MAFTQIFEDDLEATVGSPTKASDYNSVSDNTDALKERFVINHHFNNTGVTGEDGKHLDITVLNKDAAGSAVIKDLLTLTWNPDSGVPINGQGVGISVVMDDAGNGSAESATVEFVMSDVAAGSEDVDIYFYGMRAGTLTENLRILSTGGIRFPDGTTQTSGTDFESLTIASSAATTDITINNTAADGDPRLVFQLSGVAKGYVYVDDGNADLLTITATEGILLDAGNDNDLQLGTGGTGSSTLTLIPSNDPYTVYSDLSTSLGISTYGTRGTAFAQRSNKTGRFVWGLRSSNVAHGITDHYETDIYYALGQVSDTEGGVAALSLTEATRAYTVEAYYTTSNTSQSRLTVVSPIEFTVGKKSTTTLTAPGSSDNIFAVSTNDAFGSTTARFIVTGDGNIWADENGGGSDAQVTLFDEEDDAELIRALDLSRRGRGLVESKFDDFIAYNQDKLVELGILGDTVEQGGMVCFTRLAYLHNGAIWQQELKLRELQADRATMLKEIEALKNEVKRLAA